MANDQNVLNNTTQSALARAVVAFKVLTDKLNPVIKPLMDSIKMEESGQLQLLAARTLARLLSLCQSRTPCPNNKILKNVCLFLCADVELTPKAVATDLDGILLLIQQQRAAEKPSTAKKNQVDSADQANSKAIEIQRRGAIHVLKAVATYFGENLPTNVPFLWDMIMSIQTLDDSSENQETR